MPKNSRTNQGSTAAAEAYSPMIVGEYSPVVVGEYAPVVVGEYEPVPVPPAGNDKDARGKKAFLGLFPGWTKVEPREAVMVGLPATGAAYFTGGGICSNAEQEATQEVFGMAIGGDSVSMPMRKGALPESRAAKYAALRAMSKDPTIDSAIKMHIANALSSRADTVESVSIKAKDGKKQDKVVEDLRRALMPFIQKDLYEWARKAAIYGACFVRVYGRQGVGIENVRCDYYTHPRFIQKFEKGGRLAGYTTSYQGASQFSRQLQLLPPWYFVGFEIPEWQDDETTEPISVSGSPVDLSVNNDALEGLVESQEYGASLIETAYGPWLDLLDALCSLKMSRRNAARLERIIAVNTGKLDPERAARYLDQVAERMHTASAEIQTQSFLAGNVQTVVNHILPNFTDKGGIQIDAVQGTPDINGLEDVLFHVKRLGSALGVDPALLGFGELLSGGLGDGGFFRVSILAATKATILRRAIKNGIQRLCEIHVAYKYGKVFLPDEQPWEITFDSISTAIEREEQEALEARANMMANVIAAIGTVDQEMSIVDKRELMREYWTFTKMNEEAFDRVFPAEKAKAAEEAAKQMANAGEDEEESI